VYSDESTMIETNAGAKIRCVVADDHALVRQGFADCFKMRRTWRL